MTGYGLIRNLLSRRDGNVAIIFALSSVPLLAFTGAAIDYGLATRLQTKLQAADDATALALCQTPNATPAAALQTQASTTMGGYMRDASLVVDDLAIVPASQGVARQITLTSHITSGTFFSAYTSVSSPTVTAKAQCASPVPKTFEIALVLDNTGSMANSSDGQSKLQALQKAAKSFIEYVYGNPAFSDQTKMSIVPFAGAVTVKNPRSLTDYTSTNAKWIDWAGKSSYHWKNINQKLATSGNTLNLGNRGEIFGQLAKLNSATYTTTPYAYYDWDWGGCIETPPYPQNVQDTKPDINNPDSLYQQYFAPDEPGPGSADQNGYYGVTYNDTTNKSSTIKNSVWNDYLPDSNCQSQTSLEYRSAESRGCKYAAATASNIAPRKTTMIGNIDIGQNGPNWGCTSAPLQRLLPLRAGTNKATLEDLIANMSPRGSTNIHEGFMWGWRTISPNGVFSADTASYNTAATLPTDATNKVIILMTDGMNDWLNLLGNSASTGNGGLYNALGYPTNSATGDAAGTSANARLQSNPNHQTPVIESGYSNIWDSSANSGRSAIDGLFTEACTNAKASPSKGDPPKVSVYTIAFSISGDAIDSAGQTLLKNCASSPDQYFLANDSDGLIAAFLKIANSIGSLRISR